MLVCQEIIRIAKVRQQVRLWIVHKLRADSILSQLGVRAALSLGVHAISDSAVWSSGRRVNYAHAHSQMDGKLLTVQNSYDIVRARDEGAV